MGSCSLISTNNSRKLRSATSPYSVLCMCAHSVYVCIQRVCVYVCVCMHAHICVDTCVCMCGKARDQLQAVHWDSSTLFFMRNGFPINLGLPNLTRLTGQQVPGRSLSRGPQHWNNQYMLPHLTFM